MKIYILKTKGTAKIPDYVQIRDKDFVLSSHFAISDLENSLILSNYAVYKEDIMSIVQKLPFGELRQFDL